MGRRFLSLSPVDGRQKKDLFLNIGSEIEQLHDLGHAGSRHPAETGQFRIIPNRLLPQQPLKPDGERHEPRDPGNGRPAAGWLAAVRRTAILLPRRLRLPARKIDAYVTSWSPLMPAPPRPASPRWNRMEICRAAPS